MSRAARPDDNVAAVTKEGQSAQPPVSRTVVLWVAMLSAFLTPFTSSGINIALPSIGRDLGMDAVLLNWVATGYLLAAVTFLVPFGRLADIRGRKRILQLGILTDTIASFLCAFAPSGPWLLVFRALQGFAGSMMFGTSTALLTSAYPREQRGRAIGFVGASVYTGLSAGPVIGGLLTEHLGWQAVFLLNTVLGLTLTAMMVLRVPGEWAEAKGERFDALGSLLYCIGILSLVLGLSHLPAAWALGLIVLSAVSFVVFVRWERRQQHPVLDIRLFEGNPAFVLSILTALANYSATFAVSLLLSLYLQYIGALSAGEAGLILLTQPVTMVVCSLIAGRLADRLPPARVASVGMALTSLGLAMLAFSGDPVSPRWVQASLVVLGAGFGFFSTPNTHAVMGAVPRKFIGVAAGTLSTMRLTGQALSLGIVLFLFSIYIGRATVTVDNHAAFVTATRIAFSVFACLSFSGIFTSMARGRRAAG